MTTRFLIFGLCGLLSSVGSLCAQMKQVLLPLGMSGQEMTAYFYFFDEKSSELIVVDQGAEDFKKYADLDAAMRANACVAGCNGGFFDRAGKPMGGVVAQGKSVAKAHRGSSLTSGVVCVVNGDLQVMRTVKWLAEEKAGKAKGVREFVQAGPFLVEDGGVVSGLSGRKYARRTVLMTDGAGRWAIAYLPPTSLAILGKVLQKPGSIEGFQVQTALNMDGGASSGFWVKKGANRPFYLKEISRVRNFLGVRAKSR